MIQKSYKALMKLEPSDKVLDTIAAKLTVVDSIALDTLRDILLYTQNTDRAYEFKLLVGKKALEKYNKSTNKDVRFGCMRVIDAAREEV